MAVRRLPPEEVPVAVSRQALPALIHSRSPSIFLRPEEVHWRSPSFIKRSSYTSELLFSIDLCSERSLLPTSLKDAESARKSESDYTDLGQHSLLNIDGANRDGQAPPVRETERDATGNTTIRTTFPRQVPANLQQNDDVKSRKSQDQALTANQELIAALKTRRKQKRTELFWVLVLLPCLFIFAALHDCLQALVRARFVSCYVDFGVTATQQDWHFLWRAGTMATHALDANVSSTTTSTKQSGTPVLFLDISGLAAFSVLRSRSLVVPIHSGTWQGCIGARCSQLPPSYDQALLVASLIESTFILDGRILAQDYPAHALRCNR